MYYASKQLWLLFVALSYRELEALMFNQHITPSISRNCATDMHFGCSKINAENKMLVSINIRILASHSVA